MKTIVALLLTLVLCTAGFAAWMWFCIERPYRGFAPEGVFITVSHGASRRGVAHLLQRQGVIRSALAFELYSRRHHHRTLQAGEYFFDHAESAHDVFWTIAKGNVYEQPFTVREGETMFDIARELQSAGLLDAHAFLAAARDPSLIRGIAPDAKTLEGFLFPATYHLPRHPVATELTAEMVRRFRESWAQISAQAQPAADPPGEPPMPLLGVITLASLVERETPKAAERPLVAGVFWNRLHRGMPLQCDPTVIYALEQTGAYRGTLTLRDLRIDSPYNTYVHAGLPPGPIGNPGEASLRAALAPARTNYLYFVANTQRGHFFSASLAEHVKNVERYHRLLAGEPADPPPPPPRARQHKRLERQKRAAR
jgi:UPF0755 protein